MTAAVLARRPVTPIYWLALGTFAIGTEGFMIAPLLPRLASDLSVSVAAAGQLVTVFALVYAVSSPLLTTVTGRMDRRRLLILSIAAFAIANLLAFSARDYWSLMAARVLLALAAGLYAPSANALAGALLEPQRRGTALAIVNGGTTIAVALGVPLGSMIGDRFGWRTMFACVAVLALVAVVGLVAGLSRDVGRNVGVATLGERIAVVRRPAVLARLSVTLIWATGVYAVYTYVAPFLATVTGIHGAGLSVVLFAWGVSAAGGLFVGGTLTDRLGAKRVIGVSLAMLALAFFGLSLSAMALPPMAALAPVLVAIVVWGVSAWAFFPAQQTALIGIAGIAVAPVVLSLNASFMFAGFSLGAALGSLTVSHGAIVALGAVGGICVLVARVLATACDSGGGETRRADRR